MVTRWKRSRAAVSLLAFAIGTSLILSNVLTLGMLLTREHDVRTSFKELRASEYQDTSDFRWYMSDYLELFLTMAVGGPVGANGSSVYEDTYTYSRNRWNHGVTMENGDPYWSYVVNGSAAATVAESGYWDDIEYPDYDDYDDYDDYGDGSSSDGRTQEEKNQSLTQEEREKQLAERYEAIAKKVHERYQGDKNVLYTVSYDGQIKYSNAEGASLNGPTAKLPEGYNFLLYFDGEKTRIFKDGKELNVYGDGIYNDKSEWYVPGYSNFKVDDKTKNATVCMAVAKKPMIYVSGNYSSEGGAHENNRLYWASTSWESNKEDFIASVIGLLAGAALFALYVFMRKEKAEADRFLAGLTGRLWYEAKALVVLIAAAQAIIIPFGLSGYYGGSLSEIVYLLAHGEIGFGGGMYDGEGTALLLAAFWLVYLLVNDLRYNEKPWHNSLSERLAHVALGKGTDMPLETRMTRRYGAVLGVQLTLAVITLAALLFYAIGQYELYDMWPMIGGLLIFSAALIVPSFLYASKNRETAENMGAIARQIESVRGGNLTQPLTLPDEAELQRVSEQLNDIQHGMQEALEEQTKSERMKVELITNVSHDLKTPLTSIITYSELLQEEENLPDHVKEYVQILSSKATRLKGMVQDVFEVSKAAAGQLPVDLEELDFGKLLRQTMADMSETIQASPVTIRTDIPEESVMIVADGKRLYRVFQNLIQNALKYSLDGSRVYISLTADGRRAVASVKNTSRMELSGEMDFTERFVRGDQSRSDGGSGLGLSIASSFTEACGGVMKVEPVADLFVVTVEFEQLPRMHAIKDEIFKDELLQRELKSE